MLRRTFLGFAAMAVIWPITAHAANQKFAFRIKTKSGGIVGNVLIEASDVEAAKVKLMKRYPDCQILGVMVK